MNQRESVYQATINVLADHNVAWDGNTPVAKVVTKELRASIISAVTQSILVGETEMSAEGRAKYPGEKKMAVYVTGLVNNWFRKDSKLNGNTKYVAKAPGSRAGSGDEQIKALKALREAKAGDANAVALIDAAIDSRKSEIKTAKTKVVFTEDMLEKIPAELRESLGL